MSTKTLTIKEASYKRLLVRKHHNESFSDVIDKLTGSSSFLELSEVLSDKDAKLVEQNVLNNRKLWKKREKELWKYVK